MAFYKDGVISIPNVTGDVVITASAVEQFSPVVQIVWNRNYKCSYTIGDEFVLTEDNSIVTSSLMYRSGYTTYVFKHAAFATTNNVHLVGFDSDGICTGDVTSFDLHSATEHTFTLPSGTTQFAIRVSTGNVDARKDLLIESGVVEVIA